MFVYCYVDGNHYAQEFRNLAQSDAPPSVDLDKKSDGVSTAEDTSSLVLNPISSTTPESNGETKAQ